MNDRNKCCLLKGQILLWVVTLLASVNVLAGEEAERWWPTQALPKAVVRTSNQQQFPEPRAALQMMVQSVAGLAAKAVNEGRGNEMVWVNNGGGDIEKWYESLLARHSELATPDTFEPWPLVDRYAKQSIIKGYILYRSDKSKGKNHTGRSGINNSVNIATSLAGLLDGIIVNEELENEAKAHGLPLLADVREKSELWCFQTYKNQFNRRMLCFQDPRIPHVRDLAVAHKVFTTYGSEDPTSMAMEWLEPLSPILGWNGGDEYVNTDLSTSYGHIQTASDWCLNLPVLMAGSEKQIIPKAASFNPAAIDWKDTRSAVSFIDTDGDNVQWLESSFFGNDSYWGNSERGKIPFGWSCCFNHLAQLCPQAIDYAMDTRKANDWFIEWGGGYYYPDHFGRRRTNRWELLAQHARRTWQLMRKTNTRVIGFIFSDIASEEAHKACEIFASQTHGLLAILALNYSPYEAGEGKKFWAKDRNGIEVPVISARYSIWEHANNRAHAGTPAKVARDIIETVNQTPPPQPPRFDWVIAHAWSRFKHAPGTDENTENMPKDVAVAQGGVRGYTPVIWCADRLPTSIRVISPEELVWRIRMEHNPSQTKELIRQFK